MVASAEERALASGLPVLEFDIEFDPQFRQDPSVRWREAFEAGPLFYSKSARGFWVVTDYELVREIVQDPKSFSSREVYLFYSKPIPFFDAPTQLDPPQHMPIRRLIQPLLSPAAVLDLEPVIRSVTRDLIQGLVDQTGCEFNEAFALRLPAIVIMQQIGLPLEHERELVAVNLAIAHPDALEDPQLKKHKQAMDAVGAMWREVVADRRRNPRDDWTSYLIQMESEGRPLDDEMILALLGTLLRGGFDTTAGTLGYSFQYLANHPEIRQSFVADPSLIPTAVEEFLRWYGGVPMITRVAARDLELNGASLLEGDRIVILLRSANHDPSAFEEADSFEMDRKPNRHLAFGLGPHRCVGMHLARTELRIALEEWHQRIPDYHLGDMSQVTHEVSQNIRLSALPLLFDRITSHEEDSTVLATN